MPKTNHWEKDAFPFPGACSAAIRWLWGVAFFLLLCLSPTAGLAAKTVTDQLGRKVRIPDAPRRVVSLAPSITEIVYYIGRQQVLVGVSQFSDYPKAADRLPKVGSYTQPDLERIVALRPDLCIATKDGNPKALVERLGQFGIPVYAVNPRSLGTMLDSVSDIGSILNAGKRARELAGKLAARIDAVERRVEKARQRPGVFFQVGIMPIVSAGSGTFIDELVTLAGGRNLAGAATGYPRFSREQVLDLSPEVIFITSMASKALSKEVRASWMAWKNLPAARDGRIYILNANMFDRPSPRLVDGLELLAKLIHPELFGSKRFGAKP